MPGSLRRMIPRVAPALIATLAAVTIAISGPMGVSGCGGEGAADDSAGAPGESTPVATPEDSATQPDQAPSAAAAALPEGARITYTFTDSSVPPPYHRSYVLEVSAGQARLIVDSYGDVLADLTAPVTEQVWSTLSATYPTLDRIAVADLDEGCTGGTGFRLQIKAEGQDGGWASDLLDVTGSACGGVNSETDDLIAQWVSPARDLFGPMSQIAPEDATPIR